MSLPGKRSKVRGFPRPGKSDGFAFCSPPRKEGIFPLNNRGKTARPRFPGADRPSRSQSGKEERDRVFPRLPFFFPEEFSGGGFPEWLPWLDEPPPLFSLRERRDPAGDFFFRDPWEMEAGPLDEWTGFSDWPQGEAGKKQRRGDVPESDGGKGSFRPGDPPPKKKRSAGRMESVERLSPSMDETELLDKIGIRSRFRNAGKRSRKIGVRRFQNKLKA